MKSSNLVMGALLLCICGCRSYYVRVNGFSEVPGPVLDRASIYVAADENSNNPLFVKEVKDKIEYLLSQRGYALNAEESRADYRLTFKVGVASHLVTDYSDYYFTTSGSYGWHRPAYSYSYFPTLEMLYDEMLTIKVFDNKPVGTASANVPVWIGEAATSGYYANVREGIDYLLVGTFEYFGRNTKKQMELDINENDPRIKQLAAYK